MDFFSLTPEEIRSGLSMVYDSEECKHGHETGDPMLAFVYDMRLQRLAHLWAECGEDMVLTKIRYLSE